MRAILKLLNFRDLLTLGKEPYILVKWTVNKPNEKNVLTEVDMRLVLSCMTDMMESKRHLERLEVLMQQKFKDWDEFVGYIEGKDD